MYSFRHVLVGADVAIVFLKLIVELLTVSISSLELVRLADREHLLGSHRVVKAQCAKMISDV
jgi:hypothetical protein